jgi:hypothetical protein
MPCSAVLVICDVATSRKSLHKHESEFLIGLLDGDLSIKQPFHYTLGGTKHHAHHTTPRSELSIGP